MTDQETSGTTDAHITRIILIALVATMGGFLFGFDSGVINGTQEGLRLAFQSDAATTGFNIASMLLGCAAGALISGRLSDIFGRRNMLLVSGVFFLISAWGSGAAGSSAAFVFYRILGGLAVGAASILAPAYIAEIAPARIRGALATLQQIAIVAGLFAAFLSNYMLAQTAGSSISAFWGGFETWRWMFWVEIIPIALFIIALLGIPESPRFLVAKGRNEQAMQVLTHLFGEAEAADKCTAIRQSLNSDHPPRFADLFMAGKIRPIVWVGIGLASLQQLVGINVIFYYGAVLWRSAGFSEADALFQNVLTGGTSILAVIIAMVFIDRIGRKPFLFWGSVGMAVSLIVMALVFSTGTVGTNGGLQLSSAMGVTALVAGLVYAFVFNMSWGPVMWVMLGEMFPNQIRGTGLAVAGLAQWSANFMITLTFPVLLASFGLAVSYGLYAFFALVSVLFVHRLINETRGIELEDMKG